MQLAALIFDVDGTLADTERDGHRVAFNATFAAAGLDWEWDVPLYGELLRITGGKERIRYYLDRYNTAFARPAALEEFIARLHADKTRRYTEMLAHGKIPLRTGVYRLLEEARGAGLRLAIATTTTPDNVIALLEYATPSIPQSWFEVIAAGEIVPHKKPAPDIYHYTLEHMGLSARQCLAFEDSENGLHAARGAGLQTIITVNDYTREQDFSGAALVLDHLGEPDQPLTVLNGAAAHGCYLNVEWLRSIGGRAPHAKPQSRQKIN
ncbi:MAG: HAD family hydrolase [Pseudomonadota bacterium]